MNIILYWDGPGASRLKSRLLRHVLLNFSEHWKHVEAQQPKVFAGLLLYIILLCCMIFNILVILLRLSPFVLSTLLLYKCKRPTCCTNKGFLYLMWDRKYWQASNWACMIQDRAMSVMSIWFPSLQTQMFTVGKTVTFRQEAANQLLNIWIHVFSVTCKRLLIIYELPGHRTTLERNNLD